MNTIRVPKIDSNSDKVELVEWKREHRAYVQSGDPICLVETTKTVYTVEADKSGYLLQEKPEGAMIHFNEEIGLITDRDIPLDEVDRKRDKSNVESSPDGGPTEHVTRNAQQLADQHEVDLDNLSHDGIITAQQVRRHIDETTDDTTREEQGSDGPPEHLQRVVIITAGTGATQVIDILQGQRNYRIAGCLDDDPDVSEEHLKGYSVIGNVDDLSRLWKEDQFDCAIVSYNRDPETRRRLFEQCTDLGIPMINAIDSTAAISSEVSIGRGNVIGPLVHVGTETSIGDNNFISASSSIDHHNRWGSHSTTGPNCVTSGHVTVGDEVKFGTGIFTENNLRIGHKCKISSGAIIKTSVPDYNAVKVSVRTTMKRQEGSIED